MARPKRAPDEQQLSPAEWQMMRILWRIGRASVRQVLEEDLKKRNRDYRTILTFLSRMETKGFLSVEKEGNTNYYTPVLPKRKGLQTEIGRFLNEVVGADREGLELVRIAVERKLRKRAPKRRK